MPDDFDYCETLVREADKDRFVAALFAPAVHRPALYALYAFNTELARVRELAREPMPGEIRLQWWREALEGVRPEEVGPVASALKATISRYRLPISILLEMIEARSFDLYDDPMDSLAVLEAYAEKTSAALMRLAAQVLNDGKSPNIGEPIRHAGIAHAVAGLLVAFPLHAARRQLYVPLDMLRRHGARPEDALAGTATPEMKAALAELRDVAREHVSRIAIAGVPSALLPALLPAALAWPMLKRLARDVDPFAPPPLPQWQRLWLLWRAARNPRRLVDH